MLRNTSSREEPKNSAPQFRQTKPARLPKYPISPADITVSMTRAPSPQQLRDAARLYAASFRSAPWFEKWTEAKARAEIGRQIAAGSWILLATDPNGTVIGLAITIPLNRSPRAGEFSQLPLSKRCWYFSEFCVAASAQNMGLGKRLLQLALDLSKGLGADGMVTRTRVDNSSARRAFERLGFTIIANLTSETGGRSSERVVYLSPDR